MKKAFVVALCALIVSFFAVSVYAEREFSVEMPDKTTIPPVASVHITTYEKASPIYGECSGGEAAYVMALSAFGITLTQDDIHKAAGLKRYRGCNSRELYWASMKLGIDVESHIVLNIASKKERLSYLTSLEYFISQGYPVVISWNEDPGKVTGDFCTYAVVVAYDEKREVITVVDPYTGTIAGRVFTDDEFIKHWQWNNGDGSYGLTMDAVKGNLKDPKSRIKTLTFHIAEGQTVELAYKEITTDSAFFLLDLKGNGLVVAERVLKQDRSELNAWIINDADTPNFWVHGGGMLYFLFTSLQGQGDITITYEPEDGDFIAK